MKDVSEFAIPKSELFTCLHSSLELQLAVEMSPEEDILFPKNNDDLNNNENENGHNLILTHGAVLQDTVE